MKLWTPIFSAIILIATATSSAFAKDTTWNVGFVRATGTSYMDTLETVPERISAVTNGRLKIKLYDTLVPGTDQPAAVRDGRLDGSFAVNPWLSGEAPIMNYGHLPGLLTDVDEYQDMLDPLLRGEMEKVWSEKYNATQLATAVFETQAIITRKPLHTIADFKGMKTRVHNTESAALIGQLGAIPVSVNFAEIVPALQRGIVDAVMTSVGTVNGGGFPAVAKELSIWRIGTIVTWSFVVNSDSWQALPDDLKPIVEAEFRKIEDEHFASNEAFTQMNIDKLKSLGMNIYEAPPEALEQLFSDKFTKPVYDSWYALNEKTGTDGRELVAKIKALQALRK